MMEKSSVGAKGWAAALAGVVAVLMAAHLAPLSGPAVGASSAVETAVQVVDRTYKGDRLDAFLSAPDAHTSGRLALRQLMRARSQRLREMCEPPASPYVDPQLAKLPGRCLS